MNIDLLRNVLPFLSGFEASTFSFYTYNGACGRTYNISVGESGFFHINLITVCKGEAHTQVFVFGLMDELITFIKLREAKNG